MRLPSLIGLRLLSLGIALVGVAVFSLLGLPLPWLLGPMFSCLIAALLGVKLTGTPVVSESMRTILGLAVGASITVELLSQMGGYLGSLIAVPIFVFLIGAVGYPYFRRICGFDHATAYYSAMPGGLQDMLIFGEEAGGNIRALSLIHATRVLLVVSVLPFLFSFGMGTDLSQPPGTPASNQSWQEMAIMVVLAIVGWRGAKAFGMFGASILGPLILAAIASLTGIIDDRPPAEAILAAQFFIGFAVGVKYVGLTVTELRRIVVAGAGFVVILFAIAAGFMATLVGAFNYPVIETILAFSPGGQAEMAVLAIVMGADVAFVIIHHVVRLVVVLIAGPLVARLFDR